MFDLKREPNESFKDFKIRVCKNREDLGLSWMQVRDIINESFDVKLAESTYRGWWKDYSEGYQDGVLVNTSDIQEEINSKIEEYEIAKLQMQDQKREMRNLLRYKARSLHLEDEIMKAIDKVSKEKPIVWEFKGNKVTKEREGVLLLSDWHYGMEADTFMNKFNTEVFHQRVSKLLEESISLGEELGVKTLHVMNLGDMINGSIHISTRIHSTEDVIAQTMHVAEVLSNFVSELSQHFNVKFYSIRGNHDRVSQGSKAAEVAKESYAEIFPWYMKARLVGVSNVEFMDNPMDDEMIVANVLGHTIFGVHGHKDQIGNVVQSLTLMTNTIPYAVVLGHYHHDEIREVCGHLAVMNQSLCGADEYARDIRKVSRPAQKLLIFNTDGLLAPLNIYL